MCLCVLQTTRAHEEHVCGVCADSTRWCAELPGIRLLAHVCAACTNIQTCARHPTRLIVKSHLADDVNWPRLFHVCAAAAAAVAAHLEKRRTGVTMHVRSTAASSAS